MTDETIAPDAPSAPNAARSAGVDDTPTASLGAVIEEAREKKWTVPLNKKAEELFTEVLRREPMETVMAVGAELPAGIFENVVKQNWLKLKPADREEFVSELGKLSTEKGALKQVAAAENIARSGDGEDRRLAAELLYAIVGPAGAEGVKLPKYKAEPLQRRFLLTTSDWPKPWCEDADKMRALLAAFVAVADPKLLRGSKSKAPLYGFARWAGAVIGMLPPGEPAREDLIGKVMTIGSGLPEWEDQFRKATPATGIGTTGTSAAGAGGQEAWGGDAQRHDEPVKIAEPLVEGRATPDGTPPPGAPSPSDPVSPPVSAIDGRASAADTARPTSDPAARLLESIEAIKAGLGLIEQLNRSLGEERARNARLESSLSEAEGQVTGLRGANAALEQRAEEAARQLTAVRGEANEYKAEAGSIRAALEEERAGRADDVKRFSEQIDREKQYVLSGFKGKLAGALRPVFNNKRTTDGLELSPELAGFFRRWFDEVEEKLRASGIQIS